MPITTEEKFGRVLSDDSAELTYVVRGTGDDVAARDQINYSSPPTYQGMLRDNIEVEEIGNNMWLGVVRYSKSGNKTQSNTNGFSFDTGGGTQHITQSLNTVSKHGPKATAMLGGAIGYDGKTVQGVDITVPVYHFSETHFLPDSVVTNAYKGRLFSLTGSVNSGSFRGLAQGECLFLGASGSFRSDGDWEIAFKFAGSPNKSGIQVGSIGGISKKGWEYLWVQYADELDTANNQVVKSPVAAYIERVYPTGHFSALGIG